MISVIIVNYNLTDDLFECLNSIYNSKQKNKFEVIVVDNSEKKKIKNELNKKFPKVKYIKSENEAVSVVIPPMLNAAASGDYDKIVSLLKNGESTNMIDSAGDSPYSAMS